MSVPMKPIEELDDWRVRAEIKELAEQQRDIENRARCPKCGEVGIWLVEGCTDGAGRAVPDGVYCGGHGPSSVHAGATGILSMNACGWVFRDRAWFTWTEGYPRITP